MNLVKHKCGLTELDRRTCKCGIYYPTLVYRGPDRGVPGESEDEDDQLDYYGSADEDPNKDAPEVVEPINIFDRLRWQFD